MSANTILNYCSVCRHTTNHSVLFEIEEKTEYSESKTLRQVVSCLGCDNKSFREETHNYWDTFEDDYGNERYRMILNNYPSVLKGHALLKGMYNVPKKIYEVYQQTILAFKGKSLLLTAVGFRAVIEAICIQENIKGSNLESKINNLAKNRLITEKEAERLHSIRFMGNDSVHEMETPSEHKLFVVLDIIESLLKNLYIIDAQAKNVLDTIIKDYPDFEDLLHRCASKLDTSTERTIKEILGKHQRRINVELTSIEPILIDRINNGDVKFLKLGNKKVGVDISVSEQQYLFTGVEYDDLPF